MSSTRKKFRCPLCEKSYINDKKALHTHIESEHGDQIGDISAAQFYFNMKYNKNGGKCVIDRKPTAFNESTERYERFCSEKCRNQYREDFKAKMKTKYGKEHMLDDPDHQKKMLANRSISGTYVWSNGHKTTYTGSYELDFLEFMDHFMQWTNPEDVMMPAPQVFRYTEDGKDHFYVPDVFIGSLNLIIEIKSKENKHYRQRDIKVEHRKDDILGGSGYNYLKLYDKEYAPFFKYLLDMKKGE